jgi:hypothetical protein
MIQGGFAGDDGLHRRLDDRLVIVQADAVWTGSRSVKSAALNPEVGRIVLGGAMHRTRSR